MRPLKVMLVASEASADVLGAGLARSLRAKLGPGVVICGVGGAEMAAEGIVGPFDAAELSLVGFFEIAAAIPRALAHIEASVRLAEREAPDVAVLIDSWAFTSRVGQRLRRRTPDLALVKYVAPQVWATRAGRTRAVARTFDHLLTMFAFEAPLFEAEGVPTTFVGSPALNRDTSAADPARTRAKLGARPDDPILIVLPGSRPNEIKRLMPPFEEAAMRLKDARPSLRIVLPAADTVAPEVKARAARWRQPPLVIEGEAYKLDAMHAATVALACSGTVTTELGVAGCPMVVGYRANGATAMLARILARVRHLTLINIVAQREIAPEFLQSACKGPALAAAVGRLLDDPVQRAAQIAEQTAALARLGRGGPDPFDAAAEAVLQVARGRELR